MGEIRSAAPESTMVIRSRSPGLPWPTIPVDDLFEPERWALGYEVRVVGEFGDRHGAALGEPVGAWHQGDRGLLR